MELHRTLSGKDIEVSSLSDQERTLLRELRAEAKIIGKTREELRTVSDNFIGMAFNKMSLLYGRQQVGTELPLYKIACDLRDRIGRVAKSPRPMTPREEAYFYVTRSDEKVRKANYGRGNPAGDKGLRHILSGPVRARGLTLENVYRVPDKELLEKFVTTYAHAEELLEAIFLQGYEDGLRSDDDSRDLDEYVPPHLNPIFSVAVEKFGSFFERVACYGFTLAKKKRK